MTVIQGSYANELQRPRQTTTWSANADCTNPCADPRDRFEQALRNQEPQSRLARTPDSTQPDEKNPRLAPDTPARDATKAEDKKAGKSARPASEHEDEVKTATDVEHTAEIRFRLGADDASAGGPSDAVDATPSRGHQPDVSLQTASAPARYAVHTPEEHPIPAARLQEAAPLAFAGQMHWKFEVVGDRLPVFSMLIQRSENLPLQVSLQNQSHAQARPSAWSIQRLRDRLALQGVRLTEREEVDTP